MGPFRSHFLSLHRNFRSPLYDSLRKHASVWGEHMASQLLYLPVDTRHGDWNLVEQVANYLQEGFYELPQMPWSHGR